MLVGFQKVNCQTLPFGLLLGVFIAHTSQPTPPVISLCSASKFAPANTAFYNANYDNFNGNTTFCRKAPRGGARLAADIIARLFRLLKLQHLESARLLNIHFNCN